MNEINPKINEIDIIIEEGLKKIVEDKINEQIGYINFDYMAERLVEKKYAEQFKNLSFPKITKKFSYEDIINKLDKEDKYGDNKLNDIIINGIEKGIEKFIDKKLVWHWKSNTIVNSKLKEKMEDKDMSNFASKILAGLKNIFN